MRSAYHPPAIRIKTLFPAAEADFAGTPFDLIGGMPVAYLAVKVIGLFDKHLKTDFALWRTELKLDEAIYRRAARAQPDPHS